MKTRYNYIRMPITRVGRILLSLMLFASAAFCQTPNPLPNNLQIIQPSPDAAKLGKYGDIQANLFNGTPNISIPIYDLKVQAFTLPISLSYNASGIKVDELATSVGLGWSLNAGGVVSVAVRGGPDFNTDRFLPDTLMRFNPDNETLPAGGGLSDYQLAKSLVSDHVDTQQDLYYYNMSGYSGKFVFSPDLTKVIPIPYSNLRIEKKDGFTITTPDGVIYQFGALEGQSLTIDRCSVGTSDPRNSISPHISSWYLKKIITQTGRTIAFDYENVSIKYITGLDETRYVSPAGTPSGLCPLLSGKDRLCTKISSLSQLRLKKISLDDSSLVVNFIYNSVTREDMAVDNTKYGNSLNQIEITNKSRLIKRFTMSYDYFRTNPYNASLSAEENSLNCRLKLLSITEEGKSPYIFTYNETNKLPKRTSMAQDSWGFYNGANNNATLIPSGFYSDGGGANRNGSTTGKTAWLLQQLNYPTGGYTTFTYEPHIAKKNVTYTVKKTLEHFRMNTPPTGLPPIGHFTLSQSYSNGKVRFNALGTFGKASANLTGPGNLSMMLQVNETRDLYLSEGNYTVIIATGGVNDGFAFSVVSTYDSSYTVEEDMPVGGVRIAKIADYTSEGIASTRYFDYNTPGTQTSSINYGHANPYLRSEYVTRRMDGTIPIECSYMILSSSSYPELGSESPETSIGYQYVTVTTDSLGKTGRTRYTFSIRPEDLVGDRDFEGARPEWSRGLVLETVHERYNSAQNSWTPIQRERNFYKTNFHPDDYLTPHYVSEHEEIVPSFRLSVTKPEVQSGTWPFGGPKAEFSYEVFRYVSSWLRLDQTDSYSYNVDTTLNVKVSTKYTYQNLTHVQPTAIEFADSRGVNMKEIRKYAADFAGQAVYDSMIRRNFIAPAVQKEKYSGAQLVELKKTNYAFFIGQKLIMPSSEQLQNGNGPLETTLQYQQYDSIGNLLQYAKVNDLPRSYIWGYNRNFPVAEILGVTYNTAIGLVNASVINNPLSDAALRTEIDKIRTAYLNKAALISCYTYLPWTGLTSKTDAKGITTYFEYDSFGRLKLVKDPDGKILNQYDYQYSVPVTQ